MNTASWVIREKATGKILLETFDKKKVDALNAAKYEAIPIHEHLASLNSQTGMRNHNYVPDWLEDIMSEADRAIVQHPKAVFLAEDTDGTRLPNHQQWIESPVGSMWIDSQKKAILGYGPAVARPTKTRPRP